MTYDLRSLQPHQHLRALGLVLLGLVYSVQVGAQTVQAQDSAFARFMSSSTGAGKQTVAFSSSGVPVISPGVPTLSTDGTAKLNVARTGVLSNPSGNPLAVTASAKVGGAVFAPLIKKGLGLVPLLGTGIALYDLAQEVGYRTTLDTTGNLVVETQSQSDTYSWTFTSTSGGVCNGKATALEGCTCKMLPPVGGYSYADVTLSGLASATCYGRFTSGGTAYNTQSMSGAIVSTNTVYGASTVDDLASTIAAKSGWPSTSKLSSAIDQSQRLTGDQIATETPTVTGPATSTGTTKTTVNPDATTSTTTTTHNHTYQGDTITTSSVTTVNNYNPSTSTTTTTTTTEQPVESDPCKINPTSNGCRTDEFDTPAGEVPRTTKAVTFSEVNLGFAGGTCPQDKVLSFSHAPNVKVWDWVGTCNKVTTYAKPMILALATFAALMIIFGTRTE